MAVKITFPDGATKEYESGSTPASIAASISEGLAREIVTAKINGQLIDTEHSQYPVIRYKGITYFPMTSDYLTGIGLSLEWSQEDGLNVSQSGTVGNFKQNFLGAINTLGSKQYAKLVDFPMIQITDHLNLPQT